MDAFEIWHGKLWGDLFLNGGHGKCEEVLTNYFVLPYTDNKLDYAILDV
jgi:hypothetical protein